MDDSPSWGRSAARLVSFVALVAGSQMVAVYLLTGRWGGWHDDPLWVGPVAAGLAMLNTVGTMVAAFMLADSWNGR